MIVEDDEKLAAILAEELERFGHDAVRAGDLARVKEEFAALRPDLVLLDITLPRYDGFYWCRQIRTISKVPILFISARESDSDQVRALENGGDDYITKPFNLVPFAVGLLHSTFAMNALSTLMMRPVLALGWLVALAFLAVYALFFALSHGVYQRAVAARW